MHALGVSYIGVGARDEPVFTQRNPVGRVNAHCYMVRCVSKDKMGKDIFQEHWL